MNACAPRATRPSSGPRHALPENFELVFRYADGGPDHFAQIAHELEQDQATA